MSGAISETPSPVLWLVSELLLSVPDSGGLVGDQGYCPSEYKAIVTPLRLKKWTRWYLFQRRDFCSDFPVVIEGSWQLAKKNMVAKRIRREEMSVLWLFGKID